MCIFCWQGIDTYVIGDTELARKDVNSYPKPLNIIEGPLMKVRQRAMYLRQRRYHNLFFGQIFLSIFCNQRHGDSLWSVSLLFLYKIKFSLIPRFLSLYCC